MLAEALQQAEAAQGLQDRDASELRGQRWSG
jgi:hypothetical protein